MRKLDIKIKPVKVWVLWAAFPDWSPDDEPLAVFNSPEQLLNVAKKILGDIDNDKSDIPCDQSDDPNTQSIYGKNRFEETGYEEILYFTMSFLNHVPNDWIPEWYESKRHRTKFTVLR